MKISDIKLIFHKELDGVFGKDEVSSIFFRLSEAYIGFGRADSVLFPNYIIPKNKETLFFNALSRLKKQEPVQYILGKTHFYGLEFEVSPSTLIPRPETEELVDWIVSDVKKIKKTFQILDIGTGSGCIAVSLAKNLPSAKVHAIDISADALLVAKKNARTHKVDVTFHEQDVLTVSDFTSNFTVIVSNPPYVTLSEKQSIKPNVLNYEPHLALFVDNDDPLKFYKKISALAKKSLVNGGFLYFEINQYLAKEVVKLLENEGFKSVELKNDLFDNPRMVKAVHSTG